MTSLQPPFAPTEVSDALLAFPARVLGLMPAVGEIPKEFKRLNPWSPFFARVFTKGFENISFVMADGVGGNAAYRHLAAILGSYEPKHEHKEAAFTYLCSLWLKGAFLDDGKGKTIYYPEGFSL